MVLRQAWPDHVALRQQGPTVRELRQAVRSAGLGGFDQVAAVILESDGTLSVIATSKMGDGSALVGIQGWPERPPADAGCQCRAG